MDRLIAAETLTAYKRFSERDCYADEKQGERDGRSEIPTAHQEDFSAHEILRIEQAASALNNYVGRVRDSVNRIDEQITDRQLETDSAYRSATDSMTQMQMAELDELKEISGPTSVTYLAQTKSLMSDRRAFDEQQSRAGRMPRMALHLPLFGARRATLQWLTPYMTLLFVLSLLEIPINELAIQLAFEFLPPVSYMIAYFIGLSFVLLAHFLGLQILRAIYLKGAARAWRWLFAVAIMAVAIFVIYILYEMRGQIAETTAGPPSPADILAAPAPAEIQSLAPESQQGRILTALARFFPWIAVPGIEIGGVRFAQFGLFILNVMVLLIGTILSVYRHDPDPDLERAWHQLSRSQRTVNELERLYQQAAAQIKMRYARQMVDADRQRDKASQDLRRLEDERARLLDAMNSDVRIVSLALANQLAAYQRGNRSTRQSNAPPYFGQAGLATLGRRLLHP